VNAECVTGIGAKSLNEIVKKSRRQKVRLYNFMQFLGK
jgi:hypothetical protein